MSWLDALFGRTKLKKANIDPLFAITTAAVDLEEHDIRFGKRAYVGIRPMESSGFSALMQNIDQMLDLLSKDHDLRFSQSHDDLNFNWFILQAALTEDLVTAAHLVGDTLQENGFDGQLLASVFQLLIGSHACFLVYNYKRGAFYPFCQTGPQLRDNSQELRLETLLKPHLPIEPDHSRWYALWDLPEK